jgi:hypothetical protein
MNKKTAGLAAALVMGATMSVVTAATSSAAPRTWLPDADLVCGNLTLGPADWVAVPPSGTLWIQTGELAGHYVILSSAHYLMEGYQEAPPTSYNGLEPLDSRTWGTKAGFTGQTLACDFVSRWGEKGADGTYSVVGPITIARTGS